MSPQEYHTLRRYAMKYANDPDDQNDLVLLAWQESTRLGTKAAMPLLVNFMKLRGRENNRSIVGAKRGGKSIRDIWNRATRSRGSNSSIGTSIGGRSFGVPATTRTWNTINTIAKVLGNRDA
jgi:hypothetical protein